MKIFIDLDGVIFDFEGHLKSLYKFDVKDVSDEEMWDTINLVNPHDFFLDMPHFDYALLLVEEAVRLVGKENVAFLSACPKSNYESVARQKRMALNFLFGIDQFHLIPMMHGRYKYLFMHRLGDVLIDDFEKNIKPWIKHGGIGIHHTNYFDTVAELRKVAQE